MPQSRSTGTPRAGTLTAISGYTDLAEDYYGDLDFCNPGGVPERHLRARAAGRPAPDPRRAVCSARSCGSPRRRIAGSATSSAAFYYRHAKRPALSRDLLVPGIPPIALIANARQQQPGVRGVRTGGLEFDRAHDTRGVVAVRRRQTRTDQRRRSAKAHAQPVRSANVQPRVVLVAQAQ